MSGRWWRAYDEAVDDPKLVLLSDRQHRAWFNLMCLASSNGGLLPDIKVIAVKLRISPTKAESICVDLRDAGLIDVTETGVAPHNWDSRQFKSDVSNGRVKRFRERQRNVTSAVSVTPPETETETETERKKDEDALRASSPANGKYAFASGVIRLNEKHFNEWKEAFSHLDLKAELIGLTQWAGTQKDWFYAVSGALAKRNREVMARIGEARAERTKSADDHMYSDGWHRGG